MKSVFLSLTIKDWLLVSSLIYMVALAIYIATWRIHHR